MEKVPQIHAECVITQELFNSILNTSYFSEQRQSTYRTIASIDHIEEQVSYEDFFRDYLLPNHPCILGQFVTETWNSRQEWVSPDGTPNLDFLSKNFGMK